MPSGNDSNTSGNDKDCLSFVHGSNQGRNIIIPVHVNKNKAQKKMNCSIKLTELWLLEKHKKFAAKTFVCFADTCLFFQGLHLVSVTHM